mmetsp:Transcript_26807/g.23667  ORF Transcript_26807/g.23667 Transcript_26807/m.23667 type:complete len:128 (+) Transcript_26807:58-441(+)
MRLNHTFRRFNLSIPYSNSPITSYFARSFSTKDNINRSDEHTISDEIFKKSDFASLRTLYQENISKISALEAIQFLDQANYIFLDPSSAREVEYKEYISKYSIRNILYSISSLTPYEILIFLETIVL